MGGEGHDSQTPADENEDLACLNCDYNLRGLPGDPVRCPECGTENLREDLLLPSALVERQFRKLQTLPTICIAGEFAGLFGVLFSVAGAEEIALLLIVSGAVASLISAVSFRELCAYRRGWIGALIWYHVAALCLFVAVIALIVVLVAIIALLPTRGEPNAVALVIAIFMFGLWVVIRFFQRYDLQRGSWNPYSVAVGRFRRILKGLTIERAKLLRRRLLQAKESP